MVGDSLREDVAGAARLGIYTAWKRSRPDAAGVEPDVIFDDLEELLRLPVLQVAR
jgi:FMN phosphatase YigB (HAD superfamily)